MGEILQLGYVMHIAPENGFSAEDVEKMLHAAKAKEPWANKDFCRSVASTLTVMRHLVLSGKDRNAVKTPDMRGWEAACEMRAAVPAMIAQHKFAFRSENGPSDELAGQIDRIREEKLAQLDAITASLDAYFRTRPLQGPVLEGTWQENAANLFQGFCFIVGNGAISKNSPAVRFVQAALVAVERGKKELGTIEQALRRAEQALRRP